MIHTGHVTVGGALCTERLNLSGTDRGWRPDIKIWSLLLECRQLLIDGGASVDFEKIHVKYNEVEAIQSFQRISKQHGWNVFQPLNISLIYQLNPYWTRVCFFYI
ncbi:hypothetical protein EON71_00260 [bacterium]|nr:MAG: hypothetical protein EON71_00260 [bacterium]